MELRPEQITPPPGIYDVPAETYHAWLDCASSSRLNAMRTHSPAHCFTQMTEPDDPTPEMQFGTAFHMLACQPSLAHKLLLTAGQCAAMTKGKGRCSNAGTTYRAGRWYCGIKGHDPRGPSGNALPPGSMLISQGDRDRLNRMNDALYDNPSARLLLDASVDQREKSVVWRYSDISVKSRFDMVAPRFDAIVDIKTTQDASREAFERSIWNFGYFLQAAIYLTGASTAGLSSSHFIFLTIEKTPPFGVGIYRMKDDIVEAGWEEALTQLEKWQQCWYSNGWPGYASEIVDIGIPPWAKRKLEQL